MFDLTGSSFRVSWGFIAKAIGYALSLLVLLVFPITPFYGQSIDMEELKNRFFSDLSQSQIISLMETLDRNEQRTTAELGAKYKWGYIPPDRTPPVRLAQWWDRQNPRQRRQQRIQWFREHYLELNVQRAAEELGMKDRYIRLLRKLQVEEDSSSHRFEKVNFPDTDVETTERSPSAESTKPGPNRDTSGRQNPDRDAQATAQPADQSEPELASETKPPPESSAQQVDTPSRKPIWQKEMQIGGQTMIYERVGDKIRVVGESADYSHLESEPDYEFPFQDERPTPPLEDLPVLRSDTDLTLPELRFYRSGQNPDLSDDPSLR